MKDHYKTLNITSKATDSEIYDAYTKLKMPSYAIGSNDYDNFHDLMRTKEIEEAYEIIGNTYKRLKYDLNNGFVEFINPFNIKSEDFEKYLTLLIDESNQRYSTILSNDIQIIELKMENQDLSLKILKNETDYKVNLEKEKNAYYNLEEVVSDLLIKIDAQSKLLDEYSNIANEKNQSDIKLKITEEHNRSLLKNAREQRNNLFKVTAVAFFSALLVALLIFYNL